jgi:hypothetical protein
MTLEQIKAAVDAGKTVHWGNSSYRVIRDRFGQYLIAYRQGERCENYVGLTNVAGDLIESPDDFYNP